MWRVLSTLLALCLISLLHANPAPVDNSQELLSKNARGADKAKDTSCKYEKAPWGECDPTSLMKNRTLTLKKGNPSTCEATKTISRKCKKGKSKLAPACRYEKGTWSQCSPSGDMTRTDMLKEANSDGSCEKTRTMTKKCKSKNRKNKANNGQRRGRQ